MSHQEDEYKIKNFTFDEIKIKLAEVLLFKSMKTIFFIEYLNFNSFAQVNMAFMFGRLLLFLPNLLISTGIFFVLLQF